MSSGRRHKRSYFASGCVSDYSWDLGGIEEMAAWKGPGGEAHLGASDTLDLRAEGLEILQLAEVQATAPTALTLASKKTRALMQQF